MTNNIRKCKFETTLLDYLKNNETLIQIVGKKNVFRVRPGFIHVSLCNMHGIVSFAHFGNVSTHVRRSRADIRGFDRETHRVMKRLLLQEVPPLPTFFKAFIPSQKYSFYTVHRRGNEIQVSPLQKWTKISHERNEKGAKNNKIIYKWALTWSRREKTVPPRNNRKYI